MPRTRRLYLLPKMRTFIGQDQRPRFDVFLAEHVPGELAPPFMPFFSPFEFLSFFSLNFTPSPCSGS